MRTTTLGIWDNGVLTMLLPTPAPVATVQADLQPIAAPVGQSAIFPCQVNGKRPVTSHGFLDASADPQQIRRWSFKFPGCNWALSTEAAGVVVLDIDVRNDGESTLQTLLRQHGPLPDTYSVTTPSGGRHLYFAAGTHAIRSGNNKLGCGVDVKAAGGYVLIPPSVIDGVPYVANNLTPAALPDWLVHLLA